MENTLVSLFRLDVSLIGQLVYSCLVDPSLSEQQYIEKKRFYIPQCFQIPTFPAHSNITPAKPISLSLSPVQFNPSLLISGSDQLYNNLSQSFQTTTQREQQQEEEEEEEEDRDGYTVPASNSIRKRASLAMKETRVEIQEFVDKASSVYAYMNELRIAPEKYMNEGKQRVGKCESMTNL